MNTTCPNCQHRFNAQEHIDQEPFLTIEKNSSPWKLLEAYRFQKERPKLDEDVYEIAKQMFPGFDVSSPWRIITSLNKSGYVQKVGEKLSSRNRPARVCTITDFGLSTIRGLE
jgi:hypothetical protein